MKRVTRFTILAVVVGDLVFKACLYVIRAEVRLEKLIGRNSSSSSSSSSSSIETKAEKISTSTMLSPEDSVMSPEAIEIVMKSKPVNLTWIDERGNLTEHPHMGALDEDGNGGFVYNPTALRANPPALQSTLSNNQSNFDCDVRDDNYYALRRVQLLQQRNPLNNNNNNKNTNTSVRILCAVYSAKKYHQRLSAIRETWGPKCDAFLVGSNANDASLDAVHILHEGKERYGNMFQKIRSMHAYIYDNYYDQYDWFHMGGEDMLVIVENLRAYLESDEIRAAATLNVDTPGFERPLYLGQLFRSKARGWWYNTGGPGYTLNKAALKLLVTKGLSKLFTKRKSSMEDVVVGKTLKQLGVDPYPTIDRHRRQRYHHLSPGGHATTNTQNEKLYRKMSRWNETGRNVSSTESIAFHKMKPDLMRRAYALLYNLCDTTLTQ